MARIRSVKPEFWTDRKLARCTSRDARLLYIALWNISDEHGRLIVPNSDDNLDKSCYDVKRFMDVFPWLDEMVSTMNGLGWDVYSLDHEDGNSQFEFDFKQKVHVALRHACEWPPGSVRAWRPV